MAKLSVDKALLKAKSHSGKGEILEAQTIYKRILQMYPKNKRAHKGLMDLNKIQQSNSTQDPPTYIIKHLNSLYNQNQLAEVIKQATPLTQQYPKAFLIWNILGAATAQTGKLDKAVIYFEKAISLKPNYADAHNNFGNVLKAQGRIAEAIGSFNKAILLRPNYTEAYKNIGNALKKIHFNQPNTELQNTIISLLDQRSSVSPKDIATAAISLLKLEPNLKKNLQVLNINKTTQSLRQTVLELSNLSLLLKLMSVCPIPDLKLEKLLKDIRKGILLGLANFKDSPDLLQFQTALALQCFTNEYIYEECENEKKAVKLLEVSIEQSLLKGKQPSPQTILCLASYRPLHKYKWCSLLVSNNQIHKVFTRQVAEPSEESRLKSNISILGAISDNISEKVRKQYESHPYPRWVKIGLPLTPEPIKKVAAKSKIKLFDNNICTKISPSILIAGCGTGRHSISTAVRFKNSHVLAIDLSLSSLAYAKRKTEELGVTNVDYMHADILSLKKLKKQFDIIECVGVLHHMGDPMAGWRVLVDCLKEGGLLKVGLYSDLARREIIEIRKDTSQSNIGSTDAEMKSYRKVLIREKKDYFKMVKSNLDFYSMSALRDLIFNVQEHRFTIPQIKDCLDKLGLRFCGFNKKDLIEKFSKSNTAELDLYDLDKWQTFEVSNPNSFAGMYQFWCQKVG